MSNDFNLIAKKGLMTSIYAEAQQVTDVAYKRMRVIE